MAFPAQSIGLVKASTQYLSRASAFDITGDLTAETWIKWTGTVGTSTQAITGKADDGNAGGAATLDWFFRVAKSGSDTLFIFGAHNGTSYDENSLTDTGVQTIFDGGWHHLAVVFTASTGGVEFFVDAVSRGTTSITSTSIRSSGRKLYVGCRGTNYGEPIDPDVNFSMLRLWSSTRTALQLSTNYCTTLGATANLVAEYPFDGAATDNSGNGYDLTANGSPAYDADVTATCGSVAAPNVSRGLALTNVGR